jgi:MoaA/NifB/PqqE/SkfB family radical SAM enzyme
MSDQVDIWYVSDQTLCNFDCAYCVTQPQRRDAGKRMWLADDGAERFRQIVQWMAGLPWRLKVRLQTLGEPFVSTEFIKGAAWLTRQRSIEVVELVTNGSFRAEQFRRFAAEAEVSRLSLWITYHPTEISAEQLVEAAALAQSLGAFVVVHSLLFPDNREVVARMRALCEERGIRTDVTAGHNYNGAFGSADYVVVAADDPLLRDNYRHETVMNAMLAAHRNTRGLDCSAGHDYLFVKANGDIFPCLPYGRAGLPLRLGSALQAGFVPPLRRETYAPCQNDGRCSCKEDYLHLKVVHSTLRTRKSLGYYEEVGRPPAALVPEG